jgi:hypothetical protein
LLLGEQIVAPRSLAVPADIVVEHMLVNWERLSVLRMAGSAGLLQRRDAENRPPRDQQAAHFSGESITLEAFAHVRFEG